LRGIRNIGASRACWAESVNQQEKSRWLAPRSATGNSRFVTIFMNRDRHPRWGRNARRQGRQKKLGRRRPGSSPRDVNAKVLTKFEPTPLTEERAIPGKREMRGTASGNQGGRQKWGSIESAKTTGHLVLKKINQALKQRVSLTEKKGKSEKRSKQVNPGGKF